MRRRRPPGSSTSSMPLASAAPAASTVCVVIARSSGVLEAGIKAVETIDACVQAVVEKTLALDGQLIVTADHGNCDDMFERGRNGAVALDAEGRPQPKTSHTLNPVPLYVYAPDAGVALSRGVAKPGLANIAATVLQLLGFAPPDGYAPSLLE